MIILYRDSFKRDVMSELLTFIKNNRPNWDYSFNGDSEADVKIVKYTGSNLIYYTEELVKSTGELVIALIGSGCASECPEYFSSGILEVKEHIIEYIEDRGI